MVPGERWGCQRVNHGYPLLHLDNFATSLTVACKARAEWTFSPKLETSESRPNLSTVRVHRHVTDAAALKIILDALPARVPQPLLNQAVVVRSGHPSRTELSPGRRATVALEIMAGPKVNGAGPDL